MVDRCSQQSSPAWSSLKMHTKTPFNLPFDWRRGGRIILYGHSFTSILTYWLVSFLACVFCIHLIVYFFYFSFLCRYSCSLRKKKPLIRAAALTNKWIYPRTFIACSRRCVDKTLVDDACFHFLIDSLFDQL